MDKGGWVDRQTDVPALTAVVFLFFNAGSV